MRRQVSVTTRCEDGTTLNDKMLLNQAFNMQLKEQQKEIEKQKEMLLNDKKKLKNREAILLKKRIYFHTSILNYKKKSTF